MKEFLFLFTTFITYSFLGWLMETTLIIIQEKKFVNRGFLIGPYCPVYGIGSLLLLFILKKYSNDYVAMFILATVTCSIVEYLTSLLLEKLFNARWWDYSHLPFNVNGRICLTNSVLFGLGVFLIAVINPYIVNIFITVPENIFMTVETIIFIIFTIDVIVSFNIINKLKLSTIELKKDNTEIITKKVSKTLKSKTTSYIRIIKAFPNLKPIKIKKGFKK